MSRELFFIETPQGRIAASKVGWDQAYSSVVLMAHGFSPDAGMTENAKIFFDTSNLFAASNIASMAFDFLGNGQSDGHFREISPNQRIETVIFLIDWLKDQINKPLFLLGFSMGGAISVYSAAKREKDLKGLLTWSCVPSFDKKSPSATWFQDKPDFSMVDTIGDVFYTDKPDQTIADTYIGLSLPKLQIQGDQDYPGFREEFTAFYAKAKEPKEHIIIPEADHSFMKVHGRTLLMENSRDWILKNIS